MRATPVASIAAAAVMVMLTEMQLVMELLPKGLRIHTTQI